MTTQRSLVPSPIPAYQHPRGRLIAQGATALSNAELLAVLLRTGTATETAIDVAHQLLERYQGLSGLAQADAVDLYQFGGLSSSRSVQIVASFELGKRLFGSHPGERPVIKTAEDAAHYLSDMASLPQEHVRVILLDSAQRVIAAPTLYIGTTNMVSGAGRRDFPRSHQPQQPGDHPRPQPPFGRSVAFP